MRVVRHIKLAYALLVAGGLFAQETVPTQLSLSDAITMAVAANVDVKSARLDLRQSKLNYRQTQMGVLPSLNMNYSFGMNNGRSIDPFTNSFSNERLNFSRAGVNLNMTLFNGFRALNAMKRDRFNFKATQLELEAAKQDLTLNVILGYIRLLSSEDRVVLATQRLATTETQVARLKTGFDAGDGSPLAYTDVKGQLALDRVALIDAKINYKSSVLSFANLLNLDTATVAVERIKDLKYLEGYPLALETVYEEAVLYLADFKARDSRIKAAATAVKVAKANYLPEISLFGQLNTNYSSAAETFARTGEAVSPTGDFVTIDATDFPVFQNKAEFEGQDIPYLEQLENNVSTVVGLSVRLPLFNGFRAKYAVKQQKVQLERSKIALEGTHLQFKQAIAEAYNATEAAFKRYSVLQEQVDAFKESFRINEILFSNGVSNVVNYITSKNNMENAKLSLNIAKYDYLLRAKVLDFYRGVK